MVPSIWVALRQQSDVYFVYIGLDAVSVYAWHPIHG